MPAFEPFAGLRYDPSAVDPNAVVAPPYDVISPSARTELAGRHPANAVHVELPVPGPDGEDRYRRAAGLLDRWRRQGLLVTDDTPALYPYRMTPPARHGAITGVIGALRLGPDGVIILPHEETLPGPRTDRLELLRATHANLSPIWGLSLAPDFDVSPATASPPELSVVDDDGVLHELWIETDPAVHAVLDAAVARAPVVIADGHHRYDTALAYRAERGRTVGDGHFWAAGAEAVMAFVAPQAEASTVVRPVHRAVAGLGDQLDLTAVLRPWFDVSHLGPAGYETLTALAEHPRLALLRADGVWTLGPRPRPAGQADGESAPAGLQMPNAGTADTAARGVGRIPGVGDLDAAIVEEVLGSLPPHERFYAYSTEEAMRVVTDGHADAVFLVRAPTVAQISGYASTGRLMPPKTTYFWPKPRSGMVYRMV